MALTTSSRKQLWAQIFAMPHKAAAFIDNLVDELETRITAGETKSNAQRFEAQYAGDSAANSTLAETVFGVARAAGSTGTSGIDLCFGANITANDTDYATITIRRRTGAGAGTAAVIATITTQITGGLGNVTGFARLTPTTTNTAVIAGDRFTYQITKAGSGVQLPSFHAAVVETLT
jgi:hypothetical protein